MIKSEVSRLVVDMERFRYDENEVMSKVGMGAVYELTVDGRKLQYTDETLREILLAKYYDPYHNFFNNQVEECLSQYGRCLIIDCHSFPSKPLPYVLNQDPKRPDICIGTCEFHTPKRLIDYALEWASPYSVYLNRPFSGTFVPSEYYLQDKRVSSIMVEVNRSLYMDELNGPKTEGFNKTKSLLSNFINRSFRFIG
jgi:N-formylglutamate amidohydrolase